MPDRGPAGTPSETQGDRVVAVHHRAGTANRLDEDQLAVLRALAGHLMPPDAPVTVDADAAIRYIEYLVASATASTESPLTLCEIYRSGCDLVQAHARRRYGCRVQAMTPIEQDQLIWDMLESSMDGFDRFSPAYFFHTLRRHIADAMEGAAMSPN
jgi:hypothetical protein